MKIFSHVSANGIQLKEFPFLSELAMEGYIYDNQQVLDLGFSSELDIKEFEKPFPRGKDGMGRIDLLVTYDNSTLAVVELKKGVLEKEHLIQLESYFKNEEYKTYNKFSVDSFEECGKKPEWIGILVGTGINDDLISFVKDRKKDKVPIFILVLNRYKDPDGTQTFIITDIKYNTSLNAKDYTKYSFNGSPENLTKNRLFLTFVKKYIEDNPNISYEFIFDKFKCLSSKKIFLPFDEAVKEATTPNSKGNYYRYYFIKDSEAVFINNTKYAVLDWWTIDDMDKIEKLIKDCKYEYSKI